MLESYVVAVTEEDSWPVVAVARHPRIYIPYISVSAMNMKSAKAHIYTRVDILSEHRPVVQDPSCFILTILPTLSYPCSSRSDIMLCHNIHSFAVTVRQVKHYGTASWLRLDFNDAQSAQPRLSSS